MDPILVALIVSASLITLVGMPWVVFWGVARVRAASREGTPLRRSDLEAIVAAAVEDANAPILRRLDALETLADADPEVAPASRIDPSVLADALEPPDRDDLPAAARRRTRS